VVCDLMMPDLDGAAVYEWIEAHRPELATRTLFCSGGAFTPRGFAFAERIGDRLLHKPVLPKELVAAVERLCTREGPVRPA
jgi:DNA-binding response OmpR family regulator